jgi:hypothetical protein
MPALPKIFSQISDRLRANGAQSSLRPLEIASAAMQFLGALDRPDDDEVAAAAYAAALLSTMDAKQAVVRSDLIPTLHPDSVIHIDHQLGTVLARGAPAQAEVAATVVYAWYAVAANAGNQERVTRLRTAAETATLDGSHNPALARRLVTEMARILFVPPPATPTSESVFSISIDLVGSTGAKTRVMTLAGDNAERIDRLNALIYGEFCRIERKFYQHAVSQNGVSPGVDPSRFFTVKGIGDEIWLLCDSAEHDVPTIGHALIDAGLCIATQSVQFLATQHASEPWFDPHFDYGRTEPINSPVKIFMDVLAHGSNLGTMRDDALMKTVPELLRCFHGREPTSLEIASVTRRLCFSGYEPIGWAAVSEYRTDYIGHEIDRFFRTTKAARPGTVTIGASMAVKMGLTFNAVAPGVNKVITRDGTPLTGGLPQDPVHARMNRLKRKERRASVVRMTSIPCSLRDLSRELMCERPTTPPNQHTSRPKRSFRGVPSIKSSKRSSDLRAPRRRRGNDADDGRGGGRAGDEDLDREDDCAPDADNSGAGARRHRCGPETVIRTAKRGFGSDRRGSPPVVVDEIASGGAPEFITLREPHRFRLLRDGPDRGELIGGQRLLRKQKAAALVEIDAPCAQDGSRLLECLRDNVAHCHVDLALGRLGGFDAAGRSPQERLRRG